MSGSAPATPAHQLLVCLTYYIWEPLSWSAARAMRMGRENQPKEKTDMEDKRPRRCSRPARSQVRQPPAQTLAAGSLLPRTRPSLDLHGFGVLNLRTDTCGTKRASAAAPSSRPTEAAGRTLQAFAVETSGQDPTCVPALPSLPVQAVLV